MKQLITLLSLSVLTVNTLQAQVKIGSAGAPVASAVLELDGGTAKGLLLPRMTKQNMIDIPNPAEGLLVYATDEKITYLRRNDGWVKQLIQYDAFTLPYYGEFNTDGASLQVVNQDVNGGSALLGFASGIASVAVRGNTTNGVGIGGYASTGIGGYFNANANGKALITGLGRVGIGTATPTGILHIDGTNQTGNTLNIVDDQDPFVLLQKAGIPTGFVQTLGNDMKIGTVFTNLTGSFIVRTGNADRLFLDNAGLLGVGNPAADARLYVDATNTASTAVLVNDQNPSLQLQSIGVNKGYLQLNGDDIRLGTNFENTTGNVVLRTGGVDRITLDNAGDMTLGNIVNKDASLSIFAANDALNAKANIDLQSNFGTTYGPNISFTGRSPATGMIGSITTNSGFMELKAGIINPRGFQFKSADNEYMRIASNGYTTVIKRFGIQTLAPVVLFHVDGFNNADPNTMVTGEVARIQAFIPLMQFVDGNGKTGFIQSVDTDMKLGTNAENAGGNGANVVLRTAGIDRLFVRSNGNVEIGGKLAYLSTVKLAVKGSVAASEFITKTVASWPDYVFSDSYKLKSLEETEAYIKANKHLPNIPAAAVVEKDGLELGDMQKRMMEKIEELTLHLIEANKEIQLLKKQVAAINQ